MAPTVQTILVQDDLNANVHRNRAGCNGQSSAVDANGTWRCGWAVDTAAALRRSCAVRVAVNDVSIILPARSPFRKKTNTIESSHSRAG